jgi:hypothetical protein
VNATLLAVVALACVIAGGAFGLYIKEILPERHLSANSKDSVKLLIGVLSTLTALVLGLLIASAKGSYDAKVNGITEIAADLVQLDRVMAQYGPETAEARKLLRAVTERRMNEIWSAQGLQHSKLSSVEAMDAFEIIQRKLRELAPANELQRGLQSHAVAISTELMHTRWLSVARSGGSIPPAFVVVLVLWLTVIFAGLGLLADHNGTVMVSMAIGAISVSAAIFLILELDTPYEGVIRLSDEPVRAALQLLGG